MLFLSILIPIILIFNCASAPGTAEIDYFLVQTIIVSRHSIRIPCPPPLAANASVFDDNSWSMWTSKAPTTPEEWGMTKEEVYAEPMLTPRGKEVARLTGEWFYHEAMSSGVVVIPSCDQITIFSDEASRDLATAKYWIDGFGCPNNTIIEISDKNLPEMIPIVASASSIDGCNSTTEDQVLDMFPNRNVNALTQEFYSSIERVQEVLDIPWDATACTMVNKSFVPTQEDPCTLFKMPYECKLFVATVANSFFVCNHNKMRTYPHNAFFAFDIPFVDTGQVWRIFQDHLYYAQYFVQSWMLEYTSGVKNWAYGKLTVEELEELFNMHVEFFMKYSTNLYNSRAFGSEQLIYILASLNSAAKGEKVGGIEHDPLHQLVMFFSHDVNIFYLRNLLGVEWRLPSSDATTSSMLRFELMRNKVGKFFVRTSYVGSSPTNQRNA